MSIKQAVLAVGLSLMLTVAAGAGESTKGYYQGVIGRHPVVWVVGTGFAGGGGQYRYLEFGPAIPLESSNSSGLDFSFVERSSADGHKVARISGKFTDGSKRCIRGQWSSSNGKCSLSIGLQRIAAMRTVAIDKPNFAVEVFYPQFNCDTPFYIALNVLMTKQAEDVLSASAAGFCAEKANPAPDVRPSDITTTEVLYADGAMVSLLVHTVHNRENIGLDSDFHAITYAWHNGQLIMLKNADFLAPRTWPRVADAVSARLTRDKSDWSIASSRDVAEQVINPTALGLLMTFGPYSEGGSCFLLPYRDLPSDTFAAGSVAGLAAARYSDHSNRPFILTEASAMERVMATDKVAQIARHERHLTVIIDGDQAPDHIDVDLAVPREHSPLLGVYRVTSDGKVWLDRDLTGHWSAVQ